MKKIVIAMSMACSLNVFAGADVTQSETKASGQAEIIQYSISQCSTPSPLIFMNTNGMNTVSSELAYKACVEYVTSDYVYSGPWYWRSKTEKTETRKLTYKLQDLRYTDSRTLFGTKENPTSFIELSNTAQLVVANCRLKQAQLSNVAVPAAASKCQGQ